MRKTPKYRFSLSSFVTGNEGLRFTQKFRHLLLRKPRAVPRPSESATDLDIFPLLNLHRSGRPSGGHMPDRSGRCRDRAGRQVRLHSQALGTDTAMVEQAQRVSLSTDIVETAFP